MERPAAADGAAGCFCLIDKKEHEDELAAPVLAAVIPVTLAAPTAHAQDTAAGERLFVKCKTCHQVGPNAKNITGR